MENRLQKVVALAAALGLPTLASAELILTADFEAEYNDNIYTLSDNEYDAWIYKVRPGAEFIVEQGSSTYSVLAEIESGTYSKDPSIVVGNTEIDLGDDDYLDYKLKADADWEFNARNRLAMLAMLNHSHDERGSGRQDTIGKSLSDFINPLNREPDEWSQGDFEVAYYLGSQESVGRFKFVGHYMGLDYTNNETLTQFLDRTEGELKAIGYFKVAPRTSLIVETRAKQVEYDKDVLGVSRDSDEVRLFAGVEWEATAKTTGEVRVGYQEKNPDQAGVENYDSLAWEADVIWQPKSYSSLSLNGYRGTQESSNALSFIDATQYMLSWKHEWNDRLTSDLYYMFLREDYGFSVREDEIDTIGLGVAFSATEWMDLKASYTYDDRESTLAGLDYEQNVLMFGVDLEFR